MRLTLPVVAIGATWALGCPKDEPPAPEDRMMRILKAEKEKEASGMPMPKAPQPAPTGEDPNQRLAQIASGQDDAERSLPVPKDTATVHVGSVAMKLLELSTSHVAGSGKVKLSTEQLFFRVHLITQNVGKSPAAIDFSFARVEALDKPFAIARDVTRVAGTRDLHRVYGVNQREEVNLFFEVPPHVLGKGSTLVLPAAMGSNQDARIPLE